MDPRARDALEEIAGDEVWILVEVFAESRTRFLGMHETDTHPGSDQIGKNLKQGSKAAAFGNMQVLDVCRDNPQELTGLR